MEKTTSSEISIIIPAHNESRVIGDVVTGLKTSLDAQKISKRINAKIVVVNDFSADATGEVAKQAGATVINHLINRGAGGATSTGLLYAKQNGSDFAVTMDADGQHLPEDVIRGIQKITSSKIDLLIGSRLQENAGMSKTKVLGNKGLSLITRILFGVKSTDTQSGLRLFSNHALNTLEFKSQGYEFASEMLYRAHQQKLVFSEYPIQAVYTDYSRAKGQNNWNAINIIKALLRIRISEAF